MNKYEIESRNYTIIGMTFDLRYVGFSRIIFKPQFTTIVYSTLFKYALDLIKYIYNVAEVLLQTYELFLHVPIVEDESKVV